MGVPESYAAIHRWNDRLRALRLPDAPEPSLAGPLSGLAVSVKDVIDVAGWCNTANHRGFAERRASVDAPVVAALRLAGAHLIGTSTTLEFAYGGFTDEGLYPPARNPWRLDRSPGGSSAGAAAAAAAGMCDASLATDTSGSVRGPAACCGILGLKPGHGSISNAGIEPLADSLNVAGVMARRADVLARVAGVMLGRPLAHAPAMPRRIGWIRAFDADAGVASPVAEAVQRALNDFREAGATVVEAAPRSTLQAYHAACVITLLYEAWESHGRRLQDNRDDYDPRTWGRLALGAFIPLDRYTAAMATRTRLRREIDALFEDVDLLVTAGAPAAAGAPGAAAPFGMLTERFLLSPFSSTGHPALTMPIGFDEGLPLSLQVVAPHNEESRLTSLAAAHAHIRDWQAMTPSLQETV
jgi:aspartyl-tRNA(Asn)/glutamyl-tRNA(Gln) amidotransferase subunit A